MSEPVNRLQQLVVNRLVELDLSARRAAERSRGLVSYESIRKIVRGVHQGGISDRIAEGLSVALDVPISKVYEAAQAPRPLSKWDWPSRFDRLDVNHRRVVEAVAAALLDAYDAGRKDSHAG